MPCCGPWRARHVCGHILWPILLVWIANVMWITTPLAGPLLPSDKLRNIIQQIVVPIVLFGITQMVYKVAIGAKWEAARTKKGVKLIDLMVRTGGKEIFRASGYRERVAYVFLGLAGISHLLINVGYQGKVLVPAYRSTVDGLVLTPAVSVNHTIVARSSAAFNDAVVQPLNLADYLQDVDLDSSDFSFSTALLAYSEFDFGNNDLRDEIDAGLVSLSDTNLTEAGRQAAAMEVEIPAVLLVGQNFRPSGGPDYLFDPDTDWGWEVPLDEVTSDGLRVQFGYGPYGGGIDLEQFAGCITPVGLNATGFPYVPSRDGACVLLMYQVVNASIAYDHNNRILGSYIKARWSDYPYYASTVLNASSFGDALAVQEGWNQDLATSLLVSSLYAQLLGTGNWGTWPAKYGSYQPTSYFAPIGVASYVSVSTFIIFALCGLLLVLNPKEALEPVGLLAVSRWPAEVASEFYGEKLSLSKAGKKRVFLHQGGPEGWVLSTQPKVPSPGAFTPSPSAESGWKVSHPSSATKCPSMYKRQSSGSYQRQSGSYFAKRPSSHSPRPSYISPRPSYHSRPSYQSRPSHSTRPTSQSRPSYSSRPSYQTRESHSSNRPRESSQRERGHLSLNMPSHREMPEGTERRLTR